MRYIAIVEIQEIGCGVIGLKNGKVFGAKVIVPLFSGPNCEKERQIGVVGIEQKQPAKVVPVVAGHNREIGVELVVAFGEEIPVSTGEDSYYFGQGSIE